MSILKPVNVYSVCYDTKKSDAANMFFNKRMDKQANTSIQCNIIHWLKGTGY